MTSQHAALLEWARLVAVLGARFFRAIVLVLSAVALAPMLFAWGSFLVTSESMRPAISVGDVVVGKPVGAEDQVAVGRVYVFRDPAPAGDLTVHRVVELRDDGDYTTAGDANDVTDSDPVTIADLHSRAVLLVPHIGLPVIWMQSGEWVRLALWLLVTIAAFWAASRNVEGEPPKWTLLRLARDRAHGARRRSPDCRDDAEAHDELPVARDVARTARRCAAAGAAGLVLVLIGTAGSTANAGFTSRTANGPMSWRVGQWTQAYVAEVLADRPYAFWLLDEAAGAATALDRSGRSTPGRYGAAATLGQPGGLPGNPGTSMRTSSGVALTSASATSAPGVQSVELWIRTSAATGGHLVGFADSSTATSSIEDRVLRMSATGRLTYGDWSTSPQRIITTPRSYNDGSWHHVVLSFSPANGSFQDAALYVDGALVASGQTSKVRSYTGYWRVGGGSRAPAFDGLVDNVALYGVELVPQRVAAHYAAR